MTLAPNSVFNSKDFNNFETMSYSALSTYESTSEQSQQSNDNVMKDEQPSQQEEQMNIQSIATASATVYSSLDLAVENVMPSIYLTKNFIAWNEENLRTHGFTHIIIIDKHIQELYYPSPIFKLSKQSEANNLSSSEAFESFEYYPSQSSSSSSLSFGKEFEAIDLNFGEKSYLTTVLPNCYRAVKFINKALQSGGTILVIDCNGGEQKCITIIVAYLMAKHNINFKEAFARIKVSYKKADLDRFYMSQLYEYEPILQVQRSHSRGHSCSRELHAAILKRKKVDDYDESEESFCLNEANSTNKFFTTLNPLAQFNADQQQQSQIQQGQQQNMEVNSSQQSICSKQLQQSLNTSISSNSFYPWDDAME